MGSRGQRDKIIGEVRGRAIKPPGSWLCCPMRPETQGGRRPTSPPHPALLPQLWVLAIFGQKILPKLGDA